MRADRLIALLLLLQQRTQITAAEAAVELEVSERTARRDLEALAMSGVPVYSSPGRGGGWKLLGGARTDLTGLSADEARALFLAAGPALESTPELKSAMRKLTGALPETFRADAEAASTAIKIDPSGWGQISRSTPEFLDQLTNAVVAGHQVELAYTSRDRSQSSRAVSPLGLVTKRGVWYMVANTAAGLRTFRLTRIRGVAPLELPVEAPDEFDLEAEWDRIVGEVEARLVGISAEVAVDADHSRVLGFQFAGRIIFHDPLQDGRAHATISEHSARPLAAQIAGFGDTIELLDPPPELVREMERIAKELARRWLSQ